MSTTNTMSTTSVTPINIIEYMLKDDYINNILKLHNNERNSTDMTWDSNLHLSSQLWSNSLAYNNCMLEHKLFSSAQNLYAKWDINGIDSNITEGINAWINEKYLLNKSNITYEEIGHYLIMTNTYYSKVGCALTINLDKNCHVITCNYL
jgi:hypothetical protein